MRTKYLVIVGAGATLSDAARLPAKKQPPLDRGFFTSASRSNHTEFAVVRRYLLNTYDFDPLDPERDRLEAVMAIIYADIHNPDLESSAIPAFRSLIRLFNRRIAETTNPLYPTNQSKLYRIICRALDDGYSPEEICIITFNQDIQIERVLDSINRTRRADRHGGVFNFPLCYTAPVAERPFIAPPETANRFPRGGNLSEKIRVLKLHGSLNWFSKHNSRDVPKNTILSSARDYFITPRTTLLPDLMIRSRRTMYTFPLVVPPVTHKAGILHEDIHPLWTKATAALKNAEKLVVFGYSCPEMDFESANLIRRAIRQNKKLQYFSVIDPDPQVFQRYVYLTGVDRIFWFKSADSFRKGYG
ncbi:MAG: hypothetical protein V3W31_01995 [Thermodesulfobacteriota bacterium]